MNYHSVWISDIHLGSKYSQAEKLLSLLNSITCKKLFIVGDLIDFWSLENEWYWDDHASALLAKIKSLSQSIEVIILTGNHDEILKKQSYFNGLPVKTAYDYTTLSGKKLLIWHGDSLDWFQKGFLKKISSIGGIIYENLIRLNLTLSRKKNTDESSFSSAFKKLVKSYVEFITFYKMRLCRYLRKGSYDGVICGHNHTPKIKILGEKLAYYNCGDWMENSTFIAETSEGEFKLFRFKGESNLQAL